MPENHLTVSPVSDGGYRRRQVGETPGGMPIVRSSTPTLGEWYWLAYRGADGDWWPFGRRSFASRRALDAFVSDRSL